MADIEKANLEAPTEMEVFEGDRNSLTSLDCESSVEGSADEKELPSSPSRTLFPKFSFYEFGVSAVPFQEILDNIKNLKDMYKRTRKQRHEDTLKLPTEEFAGMDDDEEPKKKKIGTNTFNIKDFQSSAKFNTGNVKISKYRPPVPTWDGSYYPDAKMLRSLYRTPCRDPSGKVITSLGRDEAKGVPAWNPPETDRDIPDPKFTACSHEFQVKLLKHMDEVIDKVEKEYSKSKGNTQAHSNLKARMGADLNNLKQKRDKLKRDLKELEGKNDKKPMQKHTI